MKKTNIKTLADAYNFIEEHTIDCDISYRGGSLKVDVSDLFETGDEPAVMGAYQNYLGGGIAGAIQTGRMFDISEFTAEDMAVYELLAEACKRYFYDANNGGGDEYMQENVTGSEAGGYEATQKMPASAY
jgi:hypothetical protein